MAYFHLSARVIGRSTGRSAVACAAYRSGTELADNRYGVVHDYRPRRGITATGIAAPKDAPHWAHDRGRLWNAVEECERRKDAQLSREFVLAFPCQLPVDEHRALLQAFIKEQITAHGLVADWAIHAPNQAGDERNWHAHVMTTMRSIGPEGFAATKDRALNKPEQLIKWREAWAELQNKTFQRLQIHDQEGQPLTVDHRSYEAQGLVEEPTVHLGPHATAMERSGRATELGDLNREIAARNAAHEMMRRQSHMMERNEVEEHIIPKRRSWRSSRRRDEHSLER